MLAINFMLYDIFVILSFPSLSFFVVSFLISTERVMDFSVFSPKYSSSPSNFSVSYFIIK